MFWITFVLGFVLILAPWALDYSSIPAALWSSVILGAVMALVAGYKGVTRDLARWEYWVAGGAGLLALIAPFVLNFGEQWAATWTVAAVGAVVLILAVYEVSAKVPE